MQIFRLIAKMPTIAAYAYRHRKGCPTSTPKRPVLHRATSDMLWKTTELKYQPNPVLARALDVLFILHADHEQNCSTSAMRVVGSSEADPSWRRRRRPRRWPVRCTAAPTKPC